MIYGPDGWNDYDNYISQSNNPTESFLRKLKVTIKAVSPLQSCGPTSATMACSILKGYSNIVPKVLGDYKPQPEEMLMDFFQDPRNDTSFKSIRDNFDTSSIHYNEIPQYYPYAVRHVFNVKADFTWSVSKIDIVTYLKSGYPVQLCLIKPGHYIIIVAYDSDRDEFIYNDSWGSRHPDGKGFNKVMTMNEFATNIKPFGIIYKG